MEYGKRLNELREAKQLSIYKLSQDSGVSQGHISDLENGKYQPTIETLNKLLSPMGITLAEFFNENGDVSVLTDREKEVVASFRTMPEDKAEPLSKRAVDMTGGKASCEMLETVYY